MNRTDLIKAIAEETNIKKNDINSILESFTNVVTDELKNGRKVQLVGFGTFEVRSRPEREGRNPQTGEAMTIEAYNVPKFKAGRSLRDALNEK